MVIDLYATPKSLRCIVRAIVSEVLLIYRIVAVVTGLELTLVRVLESALL